MEAILIIAFCAAICALFIVGWAIATGIYCLMALYQGEPVAPVFRQMLEEW